MRRVTITLLVAALAVVAVPATTAGATTPTGKCSIKVPAKVVLDSPYEVIHASLGADCSAAGVDWAGWDVRHSYYGPQDVFFFDGTSTDSIGFYDDDHLGKYIVDGGDAYDVDSNELTTSTTSFVVKAGTTVGLSTARKGKYVTSKVTSTYYKPSANAFRANVKAKVNLQYKTCSTCAWHGLKTLTTDGTGKATYRRWTPKTRYYRAVLAETTYRWGRTSGTHHS